MSRKVITDGDVDRAIQAIAEGATLEEVAAEIGANRGTLYARLTSRGLKIAAIRGKPRPPGIPNRLSSRTKSSEARRST